MKRIAVLVLGAVLGVALFPPVSSAAGAFYVDSSGYVGVGNTTPAAPLDVSGGMYSRLVADSDAASTTVNWNSGNVHALTLSQSNTALVFSNGQAGGECDLIISQDGAGGRTVTWPSTVASPNGTAPTLTGAASSTDKVHFVYNGSNYLGDFAAKLTWCPPVHHH